MSRRGKIGINSLGELEVDVLRIVWERKKATVKDVFEVLYEEKRLAYTTVMTVMNRLAVKGILKQDKNKIPYVYKPAISREKMATSIVDQVIGRVLAGNKGPIVSHLVKTGKLAPEQIEELRKFLK
jgi:predicted transcriptional regulator